MPNKPMPLTGTTALPLPVNGMVPFLKATVPAGMANPPGIVLAILGFRMAVPLSTARAIKDIGGFLFATVGVGGEVEGLMDTSQLPSASSPSSMSSSSLEEEAVGTDESSAIAFSWVTGVVGSSVSASVSASVSVSLWHSGFGLGLGLLGASLLAEEGAGDILSTPAAADADEVFWLTTVVEDPVLGIDVGTSSASSSSSKSEPGAGVAERRVLAMVIVAVSITVDVVSSAAAEKEEVEKPDAAVEPTAMELFVFEVAAGCDREGEEEDGEGLLVGGAWEDGGDNIGVTGMRIVEGEVTRVEKSADGPEGTALDAHDDASAGIAVLVSTGDEDVPL